MFWAPAHGETFDRNGNAIGGPAQRGLASFATVVERGRSAWALLFLLADGRPRHGMIDRFGPTGPACHGALHAPAWRAGRSGYEYGSAFVDRGRTSTVHMLPNGVAVHPARTPQSMTALKAYLVADHDVEIEANAHAEVYFGEARWPQATPIGTPAVAVPVWLVLPPRGWAIVEASSGRLIDRDDGSQPDAPTVGRSTSPLERGYGRPAPPELLTGGDGTSGIDEITWESWGGAQAIGHGTAAYLVPGDASVDAKPEPATIVAFDLGTCDGKRAYRAVTWYFPQHDESFDRTHYFDACAGEWIDS